MYTLTLGRSRHFLLRTLRSGASPPSAGAVAEPTAKRKYVKKQKPIDLTGALRSTFRLVPNQNEINTFGSEQEDSAIPTSRPSKVDRSYVKELDKNVLSKGVRRAINLSNQEKKKDQDQEDEEKHKPDYSKPKAGPQYSERSLQLRRKRIRELASSSKEERGSLYKFKSKNWAPRKSGDSEKKHATRPTPDVNRVTRPIKASSTKPRVPSPKVAFENKNSHCISSGKTGTGVRLEQAEPLDHKNIPKLAHSLDRSLFSPGVHFLQDPRTRVYNFPPFLKNIIKFKDFNFDAIGTFQRVSKDQTLLRMAEKHRKTYYSSTSSMTSTFIQFYLLLNNYDPHKTSRFNFTPFSGVVSTSPSSSIVQPRRGATGTVYSVESDKSSDNEILLSAMGHCLETLLTTEERAFDRYRKDAAAPITPQEQLQNVYNYASIGKFLLRSQLDCYDPRLPGNGTFDLKTRAACSIRYDSSNPEIENNNYQIWRLNGDYESFSKEYVDLVRTGALLKYAFQARIGQMDGIYVAYHNIKSFFGFQYFPLQQLDEVFYNHEGVEKHKHRTPANLKELGPAEIDLAELNDGLPTYVAESQFTMTVGIYEKLLDTIVRDLPDTGFRLVMKSTPIYRNAATRLYVYAVPVTDAEIKELQSFPDSFQTSFREQITAEERAENLQAHCDRLKRFNEESVASKTVHAYHVDIDGHTIDGKPVHTRCPYPQRVGADWTVRYSIHKMDAASDKVQARNRQECLDMLARAADTLTMGVRRDKPRAESREDVVRVYSNIGHARAKEWEEQDAHPVVYRPLTASAAH